MQNLGCLPLSILCMGGSRLGSEIAGRTIVIEKGRRRQCYLVLQIMVLFSRHADYIQVSKTCQIREHDFICCHACDDLHVPCWPGKSHHRSKSGDGTAYEELTEECASPPIAAIRMFRPADNTEPADAKEGGNTGSKKQGPGQEPSLISWEELEAKKDIYRAVATPDGRQALIKKRPGGAIL
jgi:hypothetical protein